ncbi:MAG TPA: ABC transporter substrate-binding protein, partial [Burkholderiaceae bacterium]|nr:ABC transporter substrate-binding protein [Burkholderiaceae bacterium]
MTLKLLAAAALAAAAVTAAAQSPGITKTGIVVGSIQDLSGPIAAFGKQARNGLVMRADEINAVGGVNGRK